MLRFFLRTSLIILIFLPSSSLSYAQNTTEVSLIPVVAKDIFRVGITISGVDNLTGNVFSFVNVDNHTAGRFFNATREDGATDNNGVVESILSFPNQTILNGTAYNACIIVLEKLTINCTKGYNSPTSRTEFSQFLLK
jgi:hypothetical protein